MAAAAGLVIAISVYALLPLVAGLDETLAVIRRGSPRQLAVALGLEAGSFAAYVVAFHGVFSRIDPERVGWRLSYDITMAGVVATRVLATAGAGGIVLMVWALRRAGVERPAVAEGAGTFFVLLYGEYMAALIVLGSCFWLGVLESPAPAALTLLPALLGACVVSAALAAWRWGPAWSRVAESVGSASTRLRTVRAWLLAAPAVLGGGVRGAIGSIAEGPGPAIAGALWWAFDIAVLWVCLDAFGAAPAVPVVVLAYFVGMLANTLPVPGGLGAVDGGLIGALVGFGVPLEAAVVAVLCYRFFAFWLPIAPGAVAYGDLRSYLART